MQLYVLNSGLAAQTLVEDIFSLVWAEKYKEVSTFELEVPNTATNRALLDEGTIMMIDESDQPMIIETVRIKKSGKKKHWFVSGRDLTSWMELRTSSYDFSMTGTRVSAIALKLINDRIVNPAQTLDKVPNLTSVINNATDGALFDYEGVNDDLLTDVQNVLNDNNCAVRCDRIGSMGSYSFRYRIYNGTKKNVSFSDRDGTLINTQYIRSTKKWRNLCGVRYKASNAENAKTLTRIVYANGGNANVSGLNRRAIQVDANINPADYPGTRLNTALDRIGRAALAKANKVEAIDGEIPAYTTAKYGIGKDYYLGDLVKFKADGTTKTDARVLGFTWTIDTAGVKRTPTIDITADVSV